MIFFFYLPGLAFIHFVSGTLLGVMSVFGLQDMAAGRQKRSDQRWSDEARVR